MGSLGIRPRTSVEGILAKVSKPLSKKAPIQQFTTDIVLSSKSQLVKSTIFSIIFLRNPKWKVLKIDPQNVVQV